MTLHWSVKIANFLFRKFGSETLFSFLCLCVLMFSFAVLFEYLQLLKIRLHSTSLDAVRNQQREPRGGSARISRLMETGIESCVNVINLLLGMLIMLTIMTLNGYLIVAVLVGTTTGFYLFGLKVMFCKYNCFLQAAQMCNNDECSLTNENLLQNDELDQLTDTDNTTIES